MDKNRHLSPTPTESIGDYSCPICFEDYHSKYRPAKLLPCGHSFCQQCIQRLIWNISSHNCPICRTKFNPFDKFLDNIKINRKFIFN